MTDIKPPIGTLFGRVSYYNPNDVGNIIDTMELPQALYMLSQALEYANSSGLFSIQEAEVVSKALRNLNTEYLNNSDGRD
jgi:hypothetical protein